MAKVRTVNHGRIKERYNATPSAREKAYHIWLMETFPCICGCHAPSTIVHHPLTEHPEQGRRRNHEYVVPMNGHCHMRLHSVGDEWMWRPDLPLGELAHWFRREAIQEGKL
jgi:hypothetical protein